MTSRASVDRTYIAIDLKSFYASVECKERNRDPLTTNLVVADQTRTEKTISAVPPCLPEIRPLCTAPTRRLPVNAGNASEDTLVTHFPLPSAAHLLPRFSLPSQLWETLCGCACSFTSASVVCCFEVVPFIHQVKLFVKNFFQKNFSLFCGQMFSTDAQYSRTTPLTTPMIWA